MRKRKFRNIGTLTIDGEQLPAVVNASVLMELEERGISVDDMMTNGRKFSNLVAMVTLALNAGLRVTGSDEEPYCEMEVGDLIDIREMTTLTDEISALLSGKIKTVPPKN